MTSTKTWAYKGRVHQSGSARQSGGSLGMRTLDHDLADRVNRGVIKEDAAREKAHNVDELRGMLATGGMAPALDTGVDFGDSFSRGQR